MTTLQAYRFALDPNQAQLAGIRRHAGASRFAYNWGLARVKAAHAQRDAEQSYGLTGDLLTPVPWTLPALRLAWNAVKRDIAPWWDECSKEAFRAGLDQLARGLKNFTDSRQGKRKGRRVGFPRFKKRGKARDSFRYTTGAYGPADETYVKLPRIGRVKVHEPMGALTGRLAAGRGCSARPCPGPQAAGSCRSPSRSTATFPSGRRDGNARAARWASTSA